MFQYLVEISTEVLLRGVGCGIMQVCLVVRGRIREAKERVINDRHGAGVKLSKDTVYSLAEELWYWTLASMWQAW